MTRLHRACFALVISVAVSQAAVTASAPTFSKDIAPILFKNCAGCHRPGQVAPFPLLSYEDASKRARLIATVTTSRYMPPWKPDPGYGHFANERRLSDADVRLLTDWAKAGAPEGNPKETPPQPTFPSGWFSEPDQKLAVDRQTEISAGGADAFRCFVLPYPGDEEKFMKSLEFRPGNPRVVHHALVFVDTSGKARQLDAATPEPGYACFGGPGFVPEGLLGGWAPGAIPTQWPEGLAATIPKGADLILQIHYHSSGKPESDASTVGLTYTGPPSRGLASVVLGSRRIDIAPGEAHYEVKTSVVIPQDVLAIGITPHAHYLCKDMKLTAHTPDGTDTPLIWIKDWDFNWQGSYRFATPIKLIEGTRLDLDYVYDNSAANVRNPSNPPRHVTFGERTTDEMALAFLSVSLPDPDAVPKFRRELRINLLDQALRDGLDPVTLDGPRARVVRALIKRFDANGDNVLQDEEREALLKFLRSQAY